jgi:hypothetical protein
MVQVHDFNPGFGKEVSTVGSNGFGTRTFWTTAISDSDVAVQFAAGKAEMEVNNLPVRDYGTLANATGPNFQTAFDPAQVSFEVVWSRPITRRVSVPDGTLGNHYAGEYVENQVTVTWSGKNLATGFSFTSNPGTFATSLHDGGFAELGHERNGVFFGEGDGNPDSASPQASISNAGQDQAFAALLRPGADRAIPPTSAALAPAVTDLGLRDSWNDPAGSAARLLPPSVLTNGVFSDLAAKRAPVIGAARAGTFPFGSDLAATSLITEVGLPGEDILLI